MKKAVSMLLVLLLAVSALAGCGSQRTAEDALDDNYTPSTTTKETSTNNAEEDEYSERVDLVFYLLGDSPSGLSEVQDAINEILLEKVNATVDLQYSTWTDWLNKYKTVLTTGGADLIYTANYASFGQLAQSGAFLALDDLLDTVSPNLRDAYDKAALDACRINGEIMTVPCIWKQYSLSGLEYREDLRLKYDLPVPDSLENLEAYLVGISQNDPNQALVTNGTGAIEGFKYNRKLLSQGFYVYYDAPLEVTDYWFSDEFVEDMKLMKKWADMGFWSKSVLSDTTSAQEKYENGQIVAYVTGSNPSKYVNRIESWAGTHPDWEDAYLTYHVDGGYTWSNDPTADATAITKDCRNPERAMKVLELLTLDKELNLLINYGIEGIHYEVAEDGSYRNLDSNIGYEAMNAWSLRNPEYKLLNGNSGILLQEMFDEYAANAEEKGQPSIDPYSGFSEDYSSYATERAALEEIKQEYLSPLQYGLVDDVDAAVAAFREKVQTVDRDKIREELTKQWEAYCQSRGIE